jgi:SAM-dependent methyltransferase
MVGVGIEAAIAFESPIHARQARRSRRVMGVVRLTVALLGGRMGASQKSVEEGGMGGSEAQGDAAAGRSSGTEAQAAASGYLLAGQASELERLQLQSRVWEPSGRRLLEELGDGGGARVLDVGCGALGWLRILSEWVGPDGEVTGTDFDEAMLQAANEFVAREGLENVRLLKDDLFASELESHVFDLVHARFEITPLGRASEQMETYVRLARPAGTIVLEDPDPGSWRFNPSAPALEKLIELIIEAFRLSGGDWAAARHHLRLLRDFGIEGSVRADVVALPPGHPYLGLPLQFATALESRLLALVTEEELGRLRKTAQAELRDEALWGTTFTLLQFWGRTPR